MDQTGGADGDVRRGTGGETVGEYLVVVGSSAGGVEALSALVTGLPHNFPAPIILAQHLDPSRPSLLAGILAQRSTLPVRVVEGRAPLAPGIVFVVPSNRHVMVTAGEVVLLTDGDERPAPSINRLLLSAAEIFGERLVAVILSGTGSDGADGARAVKAAGGTVVVQDPQTASYPGMPLAIAPPVVDIVAEPQRIGAILATVMGDGGTEPTSDAQALDSILAELHERFGVDFSAYKRPTLLRRLRRRVAAVGAGDLGGYRAYLAANPDEYQRLMGAFLIKVTEFFRDADFFAALRDEVLPALIAGARAHGNGLRLWSAGCATGEEAYSLAILLAEALGPELEQFAVRIFATDLDEAAVAYARRGIYPPAALAAVPPEYIDRYFSREDGGYIVRKRVRGLLVFGQHDLGQRPPFPRLDLILCRNVLIYFTPELQRRTLQIFAYALRSSGVLALGKAETVSQAADSFTTISAAQKLYRRTGDRSLLIPMQMGSAPPLPRPPRRAVPGERPGGERANLPGQHQIGERHFFDLPIGVVVVDRRYDIREINSAARELLGIRGIAIGEDLIHAARDLPSRELRDTIDRTFREQATVTIPEIALEGAVPGEARHLRLVCVPHSTDGEGGALPDVVQLVLIDLTGQVAARRDLERRLAEATTTLERERAQHARLAETNERLLRANDELHRTVEELRSANEAFYLSAEEAQAAHEEAETLNEEMQATNEELETLNEELQATVEELETTTDELQSRGRDLEAMASVSEARRARLEAVLAGMNDAVLVLDEGDRPLLHNDVYTGLFGPPEAHLTALGPNGRALPPADTPRGRLLRGESFTMEFGLAGDDGAVRRFEAIGTAIRADDGRLTGLLIIRDITERSPQ